MKKRFHLLVTIPVLTGLGSVLFFLFLPYLFDFYLFPRLINELPFTEKELSLSRLSPWKIRGTLTLADDDRPTLLVPKFELHYTPKSLFRGEFSRLLVDSASLQLEMQDGHPQIRGLTGNSPPDLQEVNPSPFLLPLAVETIILKNCSITLHRKYQNPTDIIVDGRFFLDFLEQPEQKKLLSALSGKIQTRGDLTLTGELELKSMDDKYKLNTLLQAPDIGQLTYLFPELMGLRLKGGFSLNGHADFDHFSSKFTGYEMIATLPRFRFTKDNFTLENISLEKPVTLQLAGNQEKSQYSLTNIVLTKPEEITLDLEGEVKIVNRMFNGTGQLYIERTSSTVEISFEGANNKGDDKQPETTISYQMASDTLNIAEALSISSVTADGDIKIKGSTLAATLNSRIPETTLKKSKTRLINLSLHLPFHYPPLPTAAAGKLRIEKIRYQGVNSGTFRATLFPSTEGIGFTTLFTTPFVPGLKLTCDGSALMTADISAHCRIPETRLDSSTFPSFIPLPDELSLNGKLAATGEFRISNKVPAGKLTVDYRDGTLTHGENKLSGINIGVVFPLLPLLQSSPSQLCTIGSLNLGKVKLSDAHIRFRIEDDQSIFLEKSRLSWCGGKVETGGFTLSKDMKELETTLYCDRLGFTELLSQFGIDKTEGQGSLNGRLPLLISSTGLTFDDGFLFSTPGNSGIVRFNDTKQLRQGIPDINKSAYLDYSMKALENFSYNWAKLSFNSQKDDLLIMMQLDGKPAEPLPFGYKKGQIVPSNKGPGLQHPIRLDVNFRLPLQDLFQYGKNIQSIMENM
ncbi:MAG: hypothetical protein GY799_23895 [Desulfobulbaceae bacterium]|nr:hypothetical protein [Desulfobulbaceae bacterium]